MATQTLTQAAGDCLAQRHDGSDIGPGLTELTGAGGIISSPLAPSEPAELSDTPDEPPTEPTAVFEVIEPVLTTGVSDGTRIAIITLLVTANLVQVSYINPSSIYRQP